MFPNRQINKSKKYIASVMNNKIKNVTMIFLFSTLVVVSLQSQFSLFAQSDSEKNGSNRQDSSTQFPRASDSIRNPDFDMVNTSSGLPQYWNDSFDVCGSIFNCTINSTDGWFGKNSLQVSTLNNTEDTWSWVSSQAIVVKANQEYGIIAHMKLNEWATGSHIALQGYNDITGEWYQITQCPASTNGPLEWKLFDCKITIPINTTAMMVTLNAGWSSQPNKNAITTFDAIHAYRTT